MKDFLSVKKLFSALLYSLNGLLFMLKERAFQQELFVLCVLFFVTIKIDSFFYKCLLIFSWIFVMILEMINTAIEKTLDFISKEKHPEIKIAKDVASGFVFLAFLCNLFLWVVLFLKFF